MKYKINDREVNVKDDNSDVLDVDGNTDGNTYASHELGC